MRATALPAPADDNVAAVKDRLFRGAARAVLGTPLVHLFARSRQQGVDRDLDCQIAAVLAGQQIGRASCRERVCYVV